MRNLLFAAAATTALLAAASAAQAQTGPTVNATVQNSTSVTVDFRASSGFTGTPTPAFPSTINAGVTSPTSTTVSPFATSTSGFFNYDRQDNLRSCRFGWSRTRSSLTGPWNAPTTTATPSSSGVTCTATLSNVQANGNFTVSFRIQ